MCIPLFIPVSRCDTFCLSKSNSVSICQRKHVTKQIPLQVKPTRRRKAFNNPNLYVHATQRVCRVCKTYYIPSENHPQACCYHPARWTGAERSKFFGRIPETVDGTLRGIEYYYDCCDAREQGARGCTRGFHCSYDE